MEPNGMCVWNFNNINSQFGEKGTPRSNLSIVTIFTLSYVQRDHCCVEIF